MANYTYLYNILSSRTKKLTDSNPMKQAVRALGALNEEIVSLTTVNEERRPKPLNAERLARLMQLYADLQTKVRAAHKNGAKDVASQYLDEVMLLTNRDLEALRRADPMNPGDYRTATEGSEHYTVDIAGKELDQVGNSASSRFPMSVPDGKGGFIDGYFTADSRNQPTVNAREAVQVVINATQNKDLKRELEGLINGKSFGEIAKALFLRDKGFDNKEADTEIFKPTEIPEMANAVWSHVFNPKGEDKPQLNLSQEDAKRLFYMAQSIYSIGFGLEFMRDCSRIPRGGVIGQRNAAMTAMADFLGVPKLVARSNQITVITGHTPDGRPILKNGTFMEKAEGCDMHDLEVKRSPEITGMDTDVDSFLKDLADLQMLDFICGNVDRHGANFFVKTEVTKDGVLRYTGLVGIDNDASFGLLNPGMDEKNNRLFSPGRIGYISSGMADKVNSMTRADLDTLLAGFGLGAQSIEAAWNRVQTVREAISTKRVKVVADDGWVKNEITLGSFRKANIGKEKEDRFVGAAGALDVSCRNVSYSLLRMKNYEEFNYKREKARYHKEHHLEEGMHTPEEVKPELHRRARLIAIEEEKAFQRLKKDAAFKAKYEQKATDAIIREAEKNGIDTNDPDFLNGNLSREELDRKIVNICILEVAERAMKEPEPKEPVQEEQPQEAPHHYDRVKAVSGLAVRVSPLVDRLRDLSESLKKTTYEHGRSTEYRKMTEKLELLQRKTKDLLNADANRSLEPDEQKALFAAAREEFKQALTAAIEKTCCYISKKPANPSHQYGKERLDLAKQLRNATMNARQVLDEELAIENFGKPVDPNRTMLREPQPRLQNAPEVNQPQLQNGPLPV